MSGTHTARRAVAVDKRSVLALLGGNGLEWYDFVVYGSVAPILSKVFFPQEDQTLALILTFAIFAVGYIARPLGGFVVGYLGDHFGRRRALILSISLMALPTVAIGFLPTHADIGSTAALLLLAMRLLQGFAVGGEFPASMSYLVEIAPPNRRGFLGSFAMLGVVVGLVLANVVTMTTNSLLSPGDMQAWGWRVPFLVASVLVVVIFWLRLRLKESGAFLAITEEPEARGNPFLSALKFRRAEIVKIFFFLLLNSVAFYTIAIFSTTYLKTTAGFSYQSALTISLIGSAAMMGLIPLAGRLSDRIGRRKTTALAAFLILVLSYAIFLAFNQDSFLLSLAAQLVFVAILALFIGPIPALISEQFSTAHRLSALSIAFNLSIALFGGTAPMVNEFFIAQTGWREAPSLYLMMAAAVCLVSIYFLRETVDEDLT